MRIPFVKAAIPGFLIASRVVLGPALVVLCVLHAPPGGIIAVLAAAMLSDLFDGIIARRLGIATASIRVADSRADAWFFLCVGLAACLTARRILGFYAIPILTELLLQIASYSFDLVRYRRLASLHAYSAKIWGFSLYAAAGALLAYHYGGLIWVSFAFGIVSFIDSLAIKLILPGWHHDVLSAFHALRRRRTTKP